MELSIALVFAAIILLVGTGRFLYGRSGRKPGSQLPVDDHPKEQATAVLVSAPTPVPDSKSRLESALELKLEKSRSSLFGRLSKFLEGGKQGGLSLKDWDEMEEILLEADVGVKTATILLSGTKEKLKGAEGKSLKEVMHGVGVDLFGGIKHGEINFCERATPFVISIVGINGVGKTTTIGKLALQFSRQGKTVLLAAADTFRAGAIAQLKVWADRSQAQFVTGREGGDPGAVAFDSVTAAVARKIDVVLLDTAGRLHTKNNLMEELNKIHRVVKKVIPDAPHETWLVIDGTLGQNSIVQAKEFQKTIELTGVIITKLDGTAKGGAVLAIASELNLPIRYIGVGESAEDLTPFEPQTFVSALLGV